MWQPEFLSSVLREQNSELMDTQRKRLFRIKESQLAQLAQPILRTRIAFSCGLYAPRLRCLNWLNKRFRGQLPEAHPSTSDTLLGAEVIGSRYQNTIFP